MPCSLRVDLPERFEKHLRAGVEVSRRGGTSGVTGTLPVAQVAVDHLPGAGEDHARNLQHAGRFHHLVRPDDVVRHQFGEEVVAVVRGSRRAGTARRPASPRGE